MNHWGGGKGSFAQDDLKGKIYDRRLYGKMLRYLKPYLLLVIISFMILTVITASEIVIPLITRIAIDDHIVSNKTILLFAEEAEAREFTKRYPAQDLKLYEANGQAYVLLSNKNTNKIDRPELKAFEDRNMLSPVNIYVIKDTPGNRATLLKHLPQNLSPQIDGKEIPGWFAIGDDKLVICQTQLMQIPRLDRIAIRQDSTKALLYLALIYLLIITIRLLSGYSQAVLTSTFSQKAMNDLRHDVFAHLQKMPVK
ncbi:MAG: ABC transporter ATP-binding protein, partial [Candidatus Cloacimonadaceae bacterium]|nr:ABC transporter ATP-binding protein [Candidatus Cloacimonadaceae bacterium]